MNRYESGLHAESDAGPIDVGLAVTPDAMGVTIEAPLMGQLSAAFAVLRDGTTRLTALSHRSVQGLELPVHGLTDDARLAQLSSDLAEREGELGALAARTEALEAAFAAQRAHLQNAKTEAARKLSAAAAELAAHDRLTSEHLAQLATLEAERQAQSHRQATLEAEQRQTEARLAQSEQARHAEAELKTARATSEERSVQLGEERQ